MEAHFEWSVQTNVESGETELCRKDTNDLQTPTIKVQRLAYYLAVAMEFTPPERVAQNHAALAMGRIR